MNGFLSQVNSLRRWNQRQLRALALPLLYKGYKAGYIDDVTSQVIYIVDGSDWAVKRVGDQVANFINKSGSLTAEVTTDPSRYFEKIVHFGSLDLFANMGWKLVHQSNKQIVTVFHGDKKDGEHMRKQIDVFINHHQQLSKIVVSTSIMRERLCSWGIAEDKIKLIPICIDTSVFKPASEDKKKMLRKRLGISEEAICVGSFQKDGNGWGEGLEPKLIKGPDVFIKAVTLLARKYKIHCVLTGPARGYVMRGLEALGVPYTHKFLSNYNEIGDFYNCLDLYIVTSREEGGPKALMESMASGIPLISTRVGMAPDMIENGRNSFLVEVDDVNQIVEYACVILEDNNLREKIVQNGLETVKRYDYNIIGREYMELYKEVMGQ